MDNRDLETLEAQNELVVVEDGEAKIAPLLAYQLVMAEQKIKEMEAFRNNYKEKILKAMEENGIMKIENIIHLTLKTNSILKNSKKIIRN